jgi:hypothetical protein
VQDLALRCYYGHTVRIVLEGGKTAEYEIKSGVLQGDTVAPYLFVLLLDCILMEGIDEAQGLSLDGTPGRKAAGSKFHMSLRVRRQSRVYSTVPYLAFADDIAILAHSVEDAERQLHGLQRRARDCGLEINVGKGKTELQLLNGAQGTARTIDGKELTTTAAYTYLGTNPIQPERSFDARVAKAWGAAKKLDPLWKSTTPRDVKVSIFDSIVATTFYYGSQTLPATKKLAERADAALARILKYCLRAPTQYEAYGCGEIPRPSSQLVFSRLQLVGHALRRQTALGMLLLTPGKLSRIERTIFEDITGATNLTNAQVDEWRATLADLASDRRRWTDNSLRCAAEAEECAWRKVGDARRRRWTSDGRIANRVGIELTHAAAEDAVLTRATNPARFTGWLMPYKILKRTNAWEQRGRMREGTTDTART